MQETKEIDPYKVIGELNDTLIEHDGHLTLGEPDEKGNYPIIQTTEDPGINPLNIFLQMFGMYERERTIGQLCFQETGEKVTGLELWLWKSIETDDDPLPYLKVQLTAGTDGLERVDKVRRLWHYWKTDLSGEIPTDWFLK